MKRYDLDHDGGCCDESWVEMTPSDTGEWVKHEEAMTRIRELEAKVEQLESDIRCRKLSEAAASLGSAPETQAVNPSHQHREFCGALRGMPCICDATPLETFVKPCAICGAPDDATHGLNCETVEGK